MKATINKDGFLVVSPDNDLEHFALTTWWNNGKELNNLAIIANIGDDFMIDKLKETKI